MNSLGDRFNATALCNTLLSKMPSWVSAYMLAYMDTVPKIIDHVLGTMGVCSILLFFTSAADFRMPNMGFNSFVITILSAFQSTGFFMVLNGRNLTGPFAGMSQRYAFPAPSSFNLGAMVSCLSLFIPF